MKEKEIKEMLNDIINNNAKYEGRPKLCATNRNIVEISEKNCSSCQCCESLRKWTLYKLGDKINPNWVYRKVEKWYVLQDDRYDNNLLISNYKGDPVYTPVLFEGSKDECEEWVKETIKKLTWFESNFNNDLSMDALNWNLGFQNGVETVCGKILEEVSKNLVKKECDGTFDWYIAESDLRGIIKDLGIEV